jgi:1-acyl-sn-glycerol-3-phosphate acyltransferase
VKTPQDASGLWRFLHRLITVVRPLFCRLRVEGTEHVPATGGFVVACNHTVGPDYVVLGYAAPRQIYYMAKREIFAWHPWLAKFFAAVGAFPVDRGKGDVAALQTAVQVVRAGHLVGMFPEGTRSRSGKLMRGKSGAARIAMMAGAAVIPAVVINASAILPTLFTFRRRPEVVVRFGPPVPMRGDPDSMADARANTERVMQSMAALLPVELRGVYGEQPVADIKVESKERLEQLLGD